MVRVSSAPVDEMQDTRFSEILAELNQKQTALSLQVTFAWVGGAIALAAALAGGLPGFAVWAVVWAILVAVGGWLDAYQRTAVIMYDLEDEARAAYEDLTHAFDQMMVCKGKWHIDAGGAVRDIHTWKQNAGAAHIVNRGPTAFDYSLPRVLKSNITPPSIKSGKETLYFLPDLMLVVESDKVGAVAYDSLTVRGQASQFVEQEPVPADAQVVSHTWKHPNKNGGPDRRFADNPQLPVCLYESLYLQSSNGLNELLQLSRAGVVAPFAAAILALSQTNGAASLGEQIPRLTQG